jgi:superfamily II DNA or RNA helicase
MHLRSLVGEVLFRHRAERNVNYSVVRVSLPADVECMLGARKRRDKDDHAIRTLNPNKIAALRRIVTMESIWKNRIVVFCDSAEAAPYLPEMLHGQGDRLCVGVTHGKKKQTTRDAMVDKLHATERSIIVSTRVCDAAVDFPKDCVVVQIHTSSGSRQQEVQRCGRGTRGDANTARIIHVINTGTEEERFVERRITHMQELYGAGMKMIDVHLDNIEALHSDEQPLKQFVETLNSDKHPLKQFIESTGTKTYTVPARQISKRHRGKSKATWTPRGLTGVQI